MSMIKCKDCGCEVSDGAATCPNCGKPVWSKKNVMHGAIAGIIGGLFAILFMIIMLKM